MDEERAAERPASIYKDLFTVAGSDILEINELNRSNMGPMVQVGDLEDAVEDAARMDVKLMRNGSEKVRRDCAWDIMNRRGYKPKEHYEIEGAVVLKGEMADNVKKALEDISSDGTKK